jgi:F-type H+-transporting ATPase subunit c
MSKLVKISGLILILAMLLGAPALAAEGDYALAEGESSALDLAGLGAGIAAGLIAIGASMGIGRFAAAAAEGIARQPSAASSITAAVNLPLFLLEGVAIIGLVVCLLIVFTR